MDIASFEQPTLAATQEVIRVFECYEFQLLRLLFWPILVLVSHICCHT